ncbi:MAG TPA: hypothetical protein VFP65_29085 [Anaeromyxobacteraceae bacterium]|nr:hypothetical protein [Anaeromyxobacteraceae bacterium]
MRAHQDRIERLDELAKAYLAEAEAAEDETAGERLRIHADFALKFVSLTKNEIEALERELKRTELEAAVADARSRGESPTLQALQRPAPRHRQQPVTDGERPAKTRRTARRTRFTK